jgi:hypothetical protein
MYKAPQVKELGSLENLTKAFNQTGPTDTIIVGGVQLSSRGSYNGPVAPAP